MLLAGGVDLGHVEQFAAAAWARSTASAWERRDELAAVFDDRSFFESLRLEPYYAYTAAQVPEAAAFLRRADRRHARATRCTLVHGDYSPKNVLVRRAAGWCCSTTR